MTDPAIAALQAYRKRLIQQGNLAKALAVAHCIKLVRALR